MRSLVWIGAFGNGVIDAVSLAPSPDEVGHDAVRYRRTVVAIKAEHVIGGLA